MDRLPKNVFHFLKILSLSPILRVTCDESFGEITKKSKSLRFSLLSFNIGVYILHIFTFRYILENSLKQGIKDELTFIKILSLRDIQKPIDQKDFESRLEKHRTEVEPLNPNDKEVIKEALSFKMNSIIDSKNRTFNKFLAYLAVVAFLIPIYTPYLSKLKQSLEHEGVFYILILLTLFYIVTGILNLMLFFHEFIKVRSYSRYRYQDVKNSNDRSTELLQMIYYERYLTEFEWIQEVTVIKNIEKYIKGVIIMSLALVTFHNISLHFEETASLTSSSLITDTQVYVLNLSNSPSKLYDGQKSLIDNLTSGFLENSISEVILIRSGDDYEKNYKRIYSLIQSLNVNNIDITVAMNSADIDKNKLTILLKKGQIK
ncbi:hypothetical protein [Paenibacillus xylanilyticus]|uniref:Uncharacterized protein n=1 Tax=Paenibacillus xylanilyticus TaxID=248903 RepID=A0A7Y6ET87_9BACL|nr:hypothetical protein [Paenibacillus xylanilyticus]NUU75742.1 hypothetical protein [Paenibacillus xylanilyticus]